MTVTNNNAPKPPHDPTDCNDQAQLNALFEDAQRVKPNPPKEAPFRVDATEEELRVMRLNFWDI